MHVRVEEAFGNRLPQESVDEASGDGLHVMACRDQRVPVVRELDGGIGVDRRAAGLPVVVAREVQIVGQGLGVHGLVRAPRLRDRRDALLGRRVHEVHGRLRVLREPDDVPERQVLGDVVVHEVEVVSLGPPLALELLRHVGDDVVLLRVHGHDAAVLRHLREDAPQVAVRHADRAEGRVPSRPSAAPRARSAARPPPAPSDWRRVAAVCLRARSARREGSTRAACRAGLCRGERPAKPARSARRVRCATSRVRSRGSGWHQIGGGRELHLGLDLCRLFGARTSPGAPP